MDVDEAYRRIAEALRRAEERADVAERELTELRAQLSMLIDVLTGKQILGEGHRALFEKVAAREVRDLRPRVKLRVLVDKYQMQSSDVDCGARMHLCRARCCSLPVDLSPADLAEGRLLWAVEDPYRLRREEDGYCVYLDRKTGFCGAYEVRPASCRGFSCRDDARIWIDFDARIPAPMPNGMVVLDVGGKTGD